jgi:murein L,D-transpeptidase YafK
VCLGSTDGNAETLAAGCAALYSYADSNAPTLVATGDVCASCCVGPQFSNMAVAGGACSVPTVGAGTCMDRDACTARATATGDVYEMRGSPWCDARTEECCVRSPEDVDPLPAQYPGRTPTNGNALSRRAAALAYPRLAAEVEAAGVEWGSKIFLRFLKLEGMLEIWSYRTHEATGPMTLLKSYQVCSVSGDLGPKTVQGDYQGPEGYYMNSLQARTSYHLALAVQYPNARDPVKRHGSKRGGLIRVHGICGSVGCWAMDNIQMEEIYTLVEAAYAWSGQTNVPSIMLPFRMTEAALNYHVGLWSCGVDSRSRCDWTDFWRNDLKPMYDAFELTRQPPTVRISSSAYRTTAVGNPAPSLDPRAHYTCYRSLISFANFTRTMAQRKLNGWEPNEGLVAPSGWWPATGPRDGSYWERRNNAIVQPVAALYHDEENMFHGRIRLLPHVEGESTLVTSLGGAVRLGADDSLVTSVLIDAPVAYVSLGVKDAASGVWSWSANQEVPSGQSELIVARSEMYPTPTATVDEIAIHVEFPTIDPSLIDRIDEVGKSRYNDFHFTLRKQELRFSPIHVCAGIPADPSRYPATAARDANTGDEESSFPVVEVAIAVGVSAFVLCCLAVCVCVGLAVLKRRRRSLPVHKTRSRRQSSAGINQSRRRMTRA